MSKKTIVLFEIIWRGGQGDIVLAMATHTFEPTSSSAVRYEADLAGIAAPAVAGDRLVLRFTVTGGDAGAFYIPNGDGALVNGQTVNVTLP